MPYQPGPHTFQWNATLDQETTDTGDDVAVVQDFYNGEASDTTGSLVLHCQRTLDQAGTFFVQEDVTNGASTFTLALQGRMHDTDTWCPIALDGAASTAASSKLSVTDSDTATTPFTAYRVPIFPQMRVNVSAHGGGGTDAAPHSKVICKLDV